MTEPTKRPETFDDLPEIETVPIELARIVLDDFAVSNGLYGATEEFLAFYRVLYGDRLVITTVDAVTTVARLHTDDEVAEKLQYAQESWDKNEQERGDVAARDQLKVGDKYTPLEAVAVSCENYTSVPCSLKFLHTGKHVKVEDGVITKITTNSRR